MSRQELAEAINAWLWDTYRQRDNMTYREIGRLERGETRWPNKRRREAFRAVLHVNKDADIGFYINRPPQAVCTEVAPPTDIGMGDLVESPAAILTRIRQQSGAGIDVAALDALDLYLADVVDRYETEGPAVLAPEVVSQRRCIQPLLQAWVRPGNRERLVTVAARLSGLLAYMATNLGRFPSARVYGIEAFELACHVEDDNLRAWIRGTQSLTEFYAGKYATALDFAADGRRYADDGPQAVRLAVNGEARALGQLGDRRAVDRAVGQAYELLSRFPPAAGMTPCISFGLYSEARVASNAATAYLPLARTAKVLEHLGRASEVVDTSESVWSKALVRIDKATALLRSERPDPEQATILVREAMAVSRGNRIESIARRTRTVLNELGSWTTVPAVAALIDEAEAWSDGETFTDGIR